MEQVVPADVPLRQARRRRAVAGAGLLCRAFLCAQSRPSRPPGPVAGSCEQYPALPCVQLQTVPAAGGAGAAGGAQRPGRRATVQPVARLVRPPLRASREAPTASPAGRDAAACSTQCCGACGAGPTPPSVRDAGATLRHISSLTTLCLSYLWRSGVGAAPAPGCAVWLPR